MQSIHTFLIKSHDSEENNNADQKQGVPVVIKKQEPEYIIFQPLFAWLPVETIKKTWENATQYGRIPISSILKKQYKASHPTLNVTRCNEDVATYKIYYNTPAVDSGGNITQFFVGKETLVCEIYPLKSTKQCVNTLEDQLRE